MLWLVDGNTFNIKLLTLLEFLSKTCKILFRVSGIEFKRDSVKLWCVVGESLLSLACDKLTVQLNLNKLWMTSHLKRMRWKCKRATCFVIKPICELLNQWTYHLQRLSLDSVASEVPFSFFFFCSREGGRGWKSLITFERGGEEGRRSSRHGCRSGGLISFQGTIPCPRGRH